MQRTTLKQKILLVIFGILLFLVLLELGLRLGGFILLSIQEYRNRLAIRQRGTFRILCLGESTTFCGEDKYCYPKQLQDILNQKDIGVRFSVVDKGVPGTKTTAILSRLEDNLNKYNPDMVITMMGVNDGGVKVLYKDHSTDSIPLPLIKTLKTYKLLSLLRLHILDKAEKMRFYKPRQEKEYILANRYDPIELSNFKAMEDRYRKAIDLAPEQVEAYLGLARCYVLQEKFPQAEELFKKAIELDPLKIKAHIRLGHAYFEQKKFPQAEEAYKKAIELNPRNVWAHIRLGEFYSRQEKFPQAEELFKKAIDMASRINRVNWAYQLLEECYIEQKKLQESEEICKKVIELIPTTDWAYAALALLYERRGEYKLAERYFRKTNSLRLRYYNPKVRINYLKLEEILSQRNIKLVCVQYPMRSIKPLKNIFRDKKDIVFVDNEQIFKQAIRQSNYDAYFSDIFGEDFGHCTPRGNRLLAENIAKTILKEYFKID